MRIRVLTIFPELFGSFLATSLVGRAVERGLLEVTERDLRDFATDRHRTVDDEPYGGGGGMVMTAPVWLRAVRAVAEGATPWRILLSPQGRRLDDARVRELAGRGDLLLMCGRYEGIDERVRELFPRPEGNRNRVTAAAATPDGRRVGIRTYRRLYLYDTESLVGGGELTPTVVDLAPLQEDQGEGLALANDGTVWLTSEAENRRSRAALNGLRCSFR